MMNTPPRQPERPYILCHPSFPLLASGPYVPAGQCDACSPVTRTITSSVHKPPLADSAYTFPPDLLLQPISDTHSVALAPNPPTFAVLNAAAYECLAHFSSSHPLTDVPASWHQQWGAAAVQDCLQQLLALGLLVPQAYEPATPTEVSTTLAAWLHITNRCNMRCAYCYLDYTHEDMTVATGQQTIATIMRTAARHGYRQVRLKYAGGEPLLRFSVVLCLHQYAQEMAEQHDFLLDGIIISNGTLLTAEMIAQIQTAGLRLTISLDDDGTSPNQQRIYADGRNTAAATMQAIELALAHGLVPGVSITVSGQNVETLPQVVAWLLERDVPFVLNFYRAHDRVAAAAQSRLNMQAQEERIVAGMLATYRVIEQRLPRWSLLEALADRANLAAPHLRACSVGRNYLVFDSQGKIATCQMALKQAVATCADSDPLQLVRVASNGIQNPSVDDKQECAACRWRYWCAGGCPLTNYRETGSYQAKSPYCTLYQCLLPEVVRLEGLRLLQQECTDSM